MRTFPKFVGKLAALAIAVHVCFSGALSFLTERLFAHRMINVRALANDQWSDRMELTASFLESARRDGRPLIGFFGSSFTYGYPFPPSAPLSGETAEAFPDHRVINVSVLSATLEGIHASFKLAELQNCRFETVVVEIPVVNELGTLEKYRNAWRKHFADASDALKYARGSTYFRWYLRRPSGIRYLGLMFEELTLADDEIPLSLVQPYDGYFMRRESFETLRGEYADKIRVTLEAAERVSDRVVAFPTPVFLAGDDRIRYDTAAINDQIEATYAACRAVPGVTTLRLEERFLRDEKLFNNLTHLGLHGNREFGAWVAREIRLDEGRGSAVAGKTPDRGLVR